MKTMSLEAIEKVTEVERSSKERRAAAEAEAKQLVSQAQREGLARLEQSRAAEDAHGKELLRKAEEQAAKRTKQIAEKAAAEADALRQTAEERLDAAAEFIVGRVVKD